MKWLSCRLKSLNDTGKFKIASCTWGWSQRLHRKQIKMEQSYTYLKNSSPWQKPRQIQVGSSGDRLLCPGTYIVQSPAKAANKPIPTVDHAARQIPRLNKWDLCESHWFYKATVEFDELTPTSMHIQPENKLHWTLVMFLSKY